MSRVMVAPGVWVNEEPRTPHSYSYRMGGSAIWSGPTTKAEARRIKQAQYAQTKRDRAK